MFSNSNRTVSEMKMNVAVSAIFIILHLHRSWGVCPPKTPFNAVEDAKAIVKENKSPDVLIRILACRSFTERRDISAQVQSLSGKSLDRKKYGLDGIFYQNPTQKKDTDPFLDCVDVMVDSPENTFNRFLEGAFYTTYGLSVSVGMVVQILVASDDHKEALIDQYNKFAEERTTYHIEHEIATTYGQGSEYQNMLDSMILNMREPDSQEAVNENLVEEQVTLVLKEKNDKGWNDQRTVLEENLLIKPIKFAQSFLKKYQEKNHGIPIEEDIKKELGHDKQLEFGYKSLVQGILDTKKYIATRIHDSIVNEEDKFGTATVFIVGLRENPIFNDLKAAFKDSYGTSLHKFLLDAKPDFPLYRMLAELVGEDSPPPQP